MGDEPMDEDDSFYQQVPNSIPIKDEDPDSDDSFEAGPSQVPARVIPKIIPTQRYPTTSSSSSSNVIVIDSQMSGCSLKSPQMNQKKPTTTQPPKPLQSSQHNTSMSRHGSDNSFFQSSAPRSVGKATPPSLTSRPSTPNGEIIMLRNQLEQEKKKSAKIASDLQTFMVNGQKKMTAKLNDAEAENSRLRKTIEELNVRVACKPMINGGNSPITMPIGNITPISRNEIKKLRPHIPSLSGNRKNVPMGNGGTTPRRTIPSADLSAFRHEPRTSLSGGDVTFQLEESFEPTDTSTPRVPTVKKISIIGRRVLNHNNGEDRLLGAPTPKRNKPVERKMPDADDVRKKWNEMFEKMDEPKQEEDSDENDDYLDGCISKLSLDTKTRHNREKSKKRNKEKLKLLNKSEQNVVEDKKCSRCQFSMSEIERRKEMKEWEKVEIQRTEKERKDAESHLALQCSTILQGISRNGYEHIEKSASNREQAEKTCADIISNIAKRSLNEIRNTKKEGWRTQIEDKLHDKGDMKAEWETLECFVSQTDDYMWTSDSDEDDYVYPERSRFSEFELCDMCCKRRETEKRIAKRENEKLKLKLECFEEHGKAVREDLRNMTILTKSRAEEYDRELDQGVNEIFGSGDMEDDDDF